MLHLVLWIALGGAVGGVVNAFMSNNGRIALPHFEVVDSKRVYQPGVVVNIFIGAVAAVISWGLYGPFADRSIFDTHPAPLTIAALAGALLVGIGGARWITNEADKHVLHAATSKALQAAGATSQATQAAQDTPWQALQIAEDVAKANEGKRNYPPAPQPTTEVDQQPRVRADLTGVVNARAASADVQTTETQPRPTDPT